MNLLDFLTPAGASDEARYAMLNGLAAGLLSPPTRPGKQTFGEALGMGLRGGSAALMEARRLEEERAAREATLDMQRRRLAMDEASHKSGSEKNALELAELRRTLEESRKVRELAQQYSQTPEQAAMSAGAAAGSVGPTNANAARIGTQPGFDFQGYTRALAGIDPLGALAVQAKVRDAMAPKTQMVPEGGTMMQQGADGKWAPVAAGGTKRSDARRKYEEMRADGVPHEVAQAIAYNMLSTVPTADGGFAVIDKRQIGAGGVPSGVPAGAGEDQPPSPYRPASRAPGQVGGTPGSKHAERLNNDVSKFAEAVSKAGIPDMEKRLALVEKELAQYKPGEDLPGFGRTAWAPNFVVSKGGEDLRRVVAGLSNIILKERSGAAVTTPEFDRFRAEIGTGKWMSDDRLREGIRMMRDILEETKSGWAATAADEVLQEYGRRYPGLTFRPRGNAAGGPGASGAGTTGTKEITLADIDVTAKKRGLTRVEVIQAARERGYTIRGLGTNGGW